MRVTVCYRGACLVPLYRSGRVVWGPQLAPHPILPHQPHWWCLAERDGVGWDQWCPAGRSP